MIFGVFESNHESQHAEAKVIKDYLSLYNPCLISLLEGQKFGNHILSPEMTKELCPLNFTTRGTHYGPDTDGHIRNLVSLTMSEELICKQFFILNHKTDLGHRMAQDRAHEENFNKDLKNDFRVGTVKNIVKQAAPCQKRQESHKRLHEKITGKSNVNEKYKTALRTNLSPSHLL